VCVCVCVCVCVPWATPASVRACFNSFTDHVVGSVLVVLGLCGCACMFVFVCVRECMVCVCLYDGGVFVYAHAQQQYF
jgi:hypothetical protein